MADVNINNYPDFVKLADVLWLKGFDSVKSVFRGSGLVQEIEIEDQTGNTREFSEVELEEYSSRKGESQPSSRARTQQGYTKVGTLYRTSKEINISFEMRKYGKYKEIERRITNLGKLGPNRLDLDLTHRFTFGTATSMTDQDGVSVDLTVGDTLSLFNTAHTVKGAASTFRNRLGTNPQLSRGAIENMQQMRVENTINQFGQKMTIPDDILWTADDPNTINTAKEILLSTSNPSQNNPGVINALAGTLRLVVLPRLATDANGAVDTSKRKYWGVASSEYSALYLGMNEEPNMSKLPVAGSNAEEFSTQDWFFGTYAGYMIVSVAAAWVGFSSGDGAA